MLGWSRLLTHSGQKWCDLRGHCISCHGVKLSGIFQDVGSKLELKGRSQGQQIGISSLSEAQVDVREKGLELLEKKVLTRTRVHDVGTSRLVQWQCQIRYAGECTVVLWQSTLQTAFTFRKKVFLIFFLKINMCVGGQHQMLAKSYYPILLVTITP